MKILRQKKYINFPYLSTNGCFYAVNNDYLIEEKASLWLIICKIFLLLQFVQLS